MKELIVFRTQYKYKYTTTEPFVTLCRSKQSVNIASIYVNS
jgi:hypothetical protein